MLPPGVPSLYVVCRVAQWRDCKRVVNKLFRDQSDTRRYIDKVVIPLVKKRSSGASSGDDMERSAQLAEDMLADHMGKTKEQQRRKK